MESNTPISESPQQLQYNLGLLALITVTAILGSLPSAIKETSLVLSSSVQFFFRFAIAALIFLPFLRNLNLPLLRDGLIVGIFLFGAFASETIGLEHSSANRASFIFSLRVVFVALFEICTRKKISLVFILASTIVLLGVGFMSWEAGEPLIDSLWLLGCAVCESIYLILLEFFAPRHSSLSLTAVQLWEIALLGLLWSLPKLGEELPMLGETWGSLLYLGIIATALVILFYAIGMQWIPAREAALFQALEPVFGAVFAFFLLGETFGWQGFLGALMVVGGISIVLIRPFDPPISEAIPDAIEKM
ncbi:MULTISPECIES: DMT family transporter [Spirulina sp. CCY15215]|uniref:DMT family transporter n=1 Tax=Spirulina sp. CCY15215 TaxID=2767591 RepID=UPI0019510E75|nr:DMT family transporter [Spirulina major]